MRVNEPPWPEKTASFMFFNCSAMVYSRLARSRCDAFECPSGRVQGVHAIELELST